MSGVLSSWLASAVNRCRLAKLCSSRASMPFTVSASRAISSPETRHREPPVQAPSVADRLDLVHDPLHRPQAGAGEPVAHERGAEQDDRRDQQHRAEQVGRAEGDLAERGGDQHARRPPGRRPPPGPRGSDRCRRADRGQRCRPASAVAGSPAGAVSRWRSSARSSRAASERREDLAGGVGHDEIVADRLEVGADAGVERGTSVRPVVTIRPSTLYDSLSQRSARSASSSSRWSSSRRLDCRRSRYSRVPKAKTVTPERHRVPEGEPPADGGHRLHDVPDAPNGVHQLRAHVPSPPSCGAG